MHGICHNPLAFISFDLAINVLIIIKKLFYMALSKGSYFVIFIFFLIVIKLVIKSSIFLKFFVVMFWGPHSHVKG